MDNRFYFGFNTSEERKKRRKAELYSMSEQVSTFFWDEAPQHGLEMREGQQDKCSVAKDALMDVRVPEMIIKLKQGIGRLIRNFTDTGIVCIIDRRLRDEPPERYHDITWDSLPIKNRTSSLGELRKFYEGLPSAKE